MNHVNGCRPLGHNGSRMETTKEIFGICLAVHVFYRIWRWCQVIAAVWDLGADHCYDWNVVLWLLLWLGVVLFIMTCSKIRLWKNKCRDFIEADKWAAHILLNYPSLARYSAELLGESWTLSESFNNSRKMRTVSGRSNLHLNDT